MKIKQEHGLLAAIFIISLAIRLVIAFNDPNFTYDAYFKIRQIENIRTGVFPNYHDPLFYTSHIFLPLSEYFLAIMSLIFPLQYTLKIIPNLVAASTCIVGYMLATTVTGDKRAALFSAMGIAFVPIFFFKTVNSLSEYAFSVPLILFMLHLLTKIDKGKNLYTFVIGLFVISLLHSTAAIFVLGLCIYILLLYILEIRQSRKELELVLFSTIFNLWILFLFYKQPLLDHGLAILGILRGQESFNILQAMYYIGFLTLPFGAIMIYKNIFEQKRKEVHAPIAMSIAIIMLLVLNIIPLDDGLMLLGIFFALLSGEVYMGLFDYIRKTKISHTWPVLLFATLMVFAVTSAAPVLFYHQIFHDNEPTQNEVDSFNWISSNTPEDSVVFSDIKEGNLVSANSKRQNVADDNLFPSTDFAERKEDVELIYSTKSIVAAIEAMQKYNVSHLVITRRALLNRNLTKIDFYSPRCFELIYSNVDADIYRSLCRVNT